MKELTIPVNGIELHQDPETGEYLCGYVGFGSRQQTLRTREVQSLGFDYSGRRRRGVLRDIAYGYLSGFPISAILWYVLTRSLPPKRLQRRIQAWEARTGRYDGPIRLVQHGPAVRLHDLITPPAAPQPRGR